MYLTALLSKTVILVIASSISSSTADTFYIGEENKTTETDHIRGTIRSHRGFSQPSDIKIVNSGVRVKDLNQNVTDVMLVKFDFVFNESANEGSTSCNEDKLYVYTEGQTSTAYYNAMKPPTEGWIPHYITGNDFIFQFISHGCSSYRFSFEYIAATSVQQDGQLRLTISEGYLVSHPQFQQENYMDVKSSSLLINIRNATVLNVLTINILEFNLADSGDCTDALKLTGVKSDWTAAGNSAEYCNTAANLGNMKYLTTNESAVQISFVTDDANNGTGFLLHYTVQTYGCSTQNFEAYSKISPPDEEGRLEVVCGFGSGARTTERIKCVNSSWQHCHQGTAPPSLCFNKLVHNSTISTPGTASMPRSTCTPTTTSTPTKTSPPKTSTSAAAVITFATAIPQSNSIPSLTTTVRETETEMPGKERKNNINVIIGGASGGGVIVIVVLALIILVIIRKCRQGTEMKQSKKSEYNHYLEEARAGSGNTGSSSAYGHTLRELEHSVGGGEYDLADDDYQLAGPTGEEYENSASIQRVVDESEITDEYASVCASIQKQPTQNTDSVELVENDLYDS